MSKAKALETRLAPSTLHRRSSETQLYLTLSETEGGSRTPAPLSPSHMHKCTMLRNHANQIAERDLDNCPLRKRLNAAVSQLECLWSRWDWVPEEFKKQTNKQPTKQKQLFHSPLLVSR